MPSLVLLFRVLVPVLVPIVVVVVVVGVGAVVVVVVVVVVVEEVVVVIVEVVVAFVVVVATLEGTMGCSTFYVGPLGSIIFGGMGLLKICAAYFDCCTATGSAETSANTIACGCRTLLFWQMFFCGRMQY